MTIDKVVDKYVPRERQRRFLYLSFPAWMIVSYGVLLGAFTSKSVIEDLGMSGSLAAAFLKSSVFIGMLVGAFLSGFIADVFGRKMAMNVYLLFATLFTFLSGFTADAKLFITMRILAGFGYGGLMPSVNTYLSETISIRIRGMYLVLLESMWAIGSILVGLVHITLGQITWRWDYWMMGIGFALFIGFLIVPESPRFAFLKGGKKALEEVLRKEIKEEVEDLKKVKIPISELLKGEYMKRTLVIWLVWFSLSIIYYGIFLWLPKIFASKGLLEHSMWMTFLMMVFQLPGYLLAAYLIEKMGRVRSLSFFLFGTAAASLGFALVSNQPLYITMAFLTSIFCLGAWGIVYAYTPELYPTAFRTTGNGAGGTVTRIGGIIAPYIIPMFKGNVIASLVFFSILALISGIAVAVLRFETKGSEIS